MESFSASKKLWCIQIIRRIDQNLARRRQEDLEIRHDFKLLRALAMPEGESETVEAAETDCNICPKCKASEGKFSWIHNEAIYLY